MSTEIFSADAVIPIAARPFLKGAIAVEDGKITAIGPRDEIKKRFPQAKERDFPGCGLLPGLVNAHTHLDLTFFPTDYVAIEDDPQLNMPRFKSGFVDWIASVIQYRKTVPLQTLADAVAEGIERSFRSGTTTVGEISTFEGEFTLFEKSGIRAVVFPELISFDGNKARDLFEAAVALLDKYDGEKHPLLDVGLSPHAPYTVSRSLLKIISEYAREGEFKVQIHVAESFQEMEFFFDAGGEIGEKLFPLVGWTQFKPPTIRKTPIEYLYSIDFLKCAPTLVHCVQMSDGDLDRILKSNSQVVLCPRSNHFLRCGIAPVERFLEKGISLGLGTDSLASNTSLSLWDEMRFLRRALAVKSKTALGGDKLLEMATLGSARVLGLDNTIGSLEEGKRADFLAVRLKDWDGTFHNLADLLVEHTHDPDVQFIAVDGKAIVRTPRTPTPAA